MLLPESTGIHSAPHNFTGPKHIPVIRNATPVPPTEPAERTPNTIMAQSRAVRATLPDPCARLGCASNREAEARTLMLALRRKRGWTPVGSSTSTPCPFGIPRRVACHSSNRTPGPLFGPRIGRRRASAALSVILFRGKPSVQVAGPLWADTHGAHAPTHAPQGPGVSA